jgi:acetate CoA/acetoacetate CoA-transferase beta subunit
MADLKARIAKRCAMEFNDGDFINLGIGLPTQVANYIPEDVIVTLHSENGFAGLAEVAAPGEEDVDIINSGGVFVTAVDRVNYFDSATSFGLVRGGHVRATVLGAMEVAENGDLANWIVPGKKVAGMGGAMDLCAGVKKIIVATDHCEKSGESKILKKCTLPLTGAKCVTDIVTERCYFEITPEGMVLRELAPGYTVEDIKACTEADFIVPDEIGVME